MNIQRWISENTASLSGKTVAITGSTGGIGKELSEALASLGASLILLDRSKERSEKNRETILEKHPDSSVLCINVDLSDPDSVKAATEEVKSVGADIFIHNAGAYSIPRSTTKLSLDNVYTINFASPYYMIRELLPMLRERSGRVVAVSSIAHNYSKIREDDVDFSNVKAASKVYGNAKRYLTYALFELFKNESSAKLAIAHPGITFTNITAHYPKLIFAIIKHPMKIIFMKPKKASLSILKGVFFETEYKYWIGPGIFNVWGIPKIQRLRTAEDREIKKISEISERVYESYKKYCKNQ